MTMMMIDDDDGDSCMIIITHTSFRIHPLTTPTNPFLLTRDLLIPKAKISADIGGGNGG